MLKSLPGTPEAPLGRYYILEITPATQKQGSSKINKCFHNRLMTDGIYHLLRKMREKILSHIIHITQET